MFPHELTKHVATHRAPSTLRISNYTIIHYLLNALGHNWWIHARQQKCAILHAGYFYWRSYVVKFIIRVCFSTNCQSTSPRFAPRQLLGSITKQLFIIFLISYNISVHYHMLNSYFDEVMLWNSYLGRNIS